MKDDAVAKVLAAFANKLDGSEADINVKPEPTMVFLDSSQPNAVINEKNEIDKWDVPVNPEGDVQPGTPDHGEPEGGKNIVVQEDPAYYADWSEAAIGDSVHYQLRVNAMNFINTGNTDATIQQVKEYFLADYQSAHMHFDESKGLHVSIWQGDNANNSQAEGTAKKNVTKDADGATVAAGYLDYTDKADTFFKNPESSTADGNFGKNGDIFGDGTGIMVPWVKISEKNPEAPDPDFPIYTTTKVPTGEYREATAAEVQAGAKTVTDGEKVYLLDKDNQKIPLYDTYYVYSLYNSDVTIVVDYYMILDDDAIVDEPGNKNFAQYGWSPVDNKDPQTGEPTVPTPPDDDDKPSQKEEVDEATVYTYALAWVKTDEKGNQLAGAKFQLPFYVKETKDGNTYVYAGENPADKTGLTNELTTTAADAVITIKGVKQGTYSITETEAPEGYNKLTEPFDVEAKKTGEGETTKTKTTIYLDAKGNVTETVTSTTKEYNTDTDSFNNASATGDEEKSVPVYQFNPIVNQKGTELPSTGGIGTTIFYVMGSILVICAGVVLVTRRRMAA
jgi:LPXTG-motif cell wall-anchored protein